MPEPFFNKVGGNTFSIEHLRPTASGINALAKIWNQNCSIWASLYNFNYLQIFVKAKFTVVKYNSKIIIYHQIKFRKGIMCRSSIKRPFLKISQYSQKKSLCWSVFLNKNAGLQSWNIIKKRLQHRYFPVNTVLRNFKNACFKEYL